MVWSFESISLSRAINSDCVEVCVGGKKIENLGSKPSRVKRFVLLK